MSVTLQSTYDAYMGPRVAGMLAAPNYAARGVVATSAITAGRAVVRSATAGKGEHPDAAGVAVSAASILGVAMLRTARELPGGAYPIGEHLDVVHQGTVWVVTEDAVTAGAAVFVRQAGTGEKGAFRGTADSGNAIQLAGARFATAGGAGALVQLEVNLP